MPCKKWNGINNLEPIICDSVLEIGFVILHPVPILGDSIQIGNMIVSIEGK